MSGRKLTITLPEPCEESWEGMQPVSGGRHCESCAKTVTDLSSYTDAQLIDFFSRKISAGACCRLRDDQLNRTMQELPRPSVGALIWQRAAAVLLAAHVLFTESVAQTTKRVHQTARPAGKVQKPAQRLLKGQLFGIKSRSINGPYAQITLQIGDTATVQVRPDSNNRFVIPLPHDFKEGLLRWAMQEYAGGLILDDSVRVDVDVMASGISLQWQAPVVMPPAVVISPRAVTLGGAPVPRYEREVTIKTPWLFKRGFSLRKKTRK